MCQRIWGVEGVGVSEDLEVNGKGRERVFSGWVVDGFVVGLVDEGLVSWLWVCGELVVGLW